MYTTLKKYIIKVHLKKMIKMIKKKMIALCVI